MFDGSESELETTVCVVGSGFAGSVVAVALAEAGFDVVVLEAGDASPDHRLNEMLDRVDVSGAVELNFGFSRQLGGASNLWAGRLAPLEEIDFERRDWVPASGWPIARNELEPYYTRAASILEIPGHDCFAVPADAHPAFLSDTSVELKAFQWATRPFSARVYLENAARQFRNLTVVTNAPVVALEENDSARAVDAAAVALSDERRARVRAKVFVIAAGGIQTPRLLLNSTGLRPAGIGNDHDVVGRYFSTHPKAEMAALVLRRPVSTRHPLITNRRVESGVMRFGLGFNAAAQRTRRFLNHYVQVHAFPEHRANKLFDRIKGSDWMNSPLIDRGPLLSGALPGLGKIVFDRIGRIGDLQRRARKFIFRAMMDQFPNPENRVTLSAERDRYGMRKANVKWTFSAEDRAGVIAFFDALKGELVSTAVRRFDYDRIRSVDDWPLTGIHSHFIGATRIGDDPQTSAANADCRVHGSANLFIAGPSLFPVPGYANPVYTIVALALRLADRLKERSK